MRNAILEALDRAINGPPPATRDPLADAAAEILGEKSVATAAQIKSIDAAQKRYDTLSDEILRLASSLGNRGFERQALANAQLVAEGRKIDTLPIYTRESHDSVLQGKIRVLKLGQHVITRETAPVLIEVLLTGLSRVEPFLEKAAVKEQRRKAAYGKTYVEDISTTDAKAFRRYLAARLESLRNGTASGSPKSFVKYLY